MELIIVKCRHVTDAKEPSIGALKNEVGLRIRATLLTTFLMVSLLQDRRFGGDTNGKASTLCTCRV